MLSSRAVLSMLRPSWTVVLAKFGGTHLARALARRFPREIRPLALRCPSETALRRGDNGCQRRPEHGAGESAARSGSPCRPRDAGRSGGAAQALPEALLDIWDPHSGHGLGTGENDCWSTEPSGHFPRVPVPSDGMGGIARGSPVDKNPSRRLSCRATDELMNQT